MKRILLVDDDKFLIRVYKSKLEARGYITEMVEDSENALNTAKLFKPDFIILDLIMPKMDGYKVLELLKNDVETEYIPVFVLSILGNEDDYVRATKLGAIGCAQKTKISFEDMIKTIEKYLN